VDTLLLNAAWDLTLDAMGNIAVATDGYALAQDVASAARLFQGELWYDTAQGVPYFGQILGQMPPLPFIAAQYQAAGVTVPGVASVAVSFTSFVNRNLGGELLITNEAGQTFIAGSAGLQTLPWYVQAVGP
jgi:hypothetical protein